MTNQTKTIIYPAAFILILLIAWELIVKLNHIASWVLPAPSLIAKSLWLTRDILLSHTIRTIQETFQGLLFAILIAIPLSSVLELSPTLRMTVSPLLIATQTVPIISVAPLFLLWFGYGMLSKVIIVALVCFFPITINLLDGFKSVSNDQVKLLKSMGANWYQIIRYIRLPAALPYLFSGLRIAATYSVMAAIIGEWLGAERGLGVFMTRSSKSFLTEQVFAAIFVITVLSLIIFGMIELIARYALPYLYRKEIHAHWE